MSSVVRDAIPDVKNQANWASVTVASGGKKDHVSGGLGGRALPE